MSFDPARFKTARKAKKLTQGEIAEVTGVTSQAVSGWERGESEPETDKLAVLGETLGRSVDWLLGRNDASDVRSEDVSAELDGTPRRTLKVKGYVGAGGRTHNYDVSQGDLEEIEASHQDPPNAVAVEIMGSSLGPLFDRWYAIYSDVRRPVTDDLVGSLCVVGLANGKVLIKRLRKEGPNYVLESNSREEQPIRGERIEWAAKVTSVRQK